MGINPKAFLFTELVSVNANLLLVLCLLLELNLSVNESKKCIVLADTDIVAGMDSSTSLSYDNVTCKHGLTVSLLYAKALGLTVTAVLGRTDTLLMSKEL